jgi:hypothetical protein
MNLNAMYDGVANSPETQLAQDIGTADTSFSVVDGSVLPSAPNFAVIGTDEDAETIYYRVKNENILQNITRHYEGPPSAWPSGSTIARNFTHADYFSLIYNVKTLNEGKLELVADGLEANGVTVGHQGSGVTPGTYSKVTVTHLGHVTNGSTLAAADIPSLDWNKITEGKPTTLAGYGITDSVCKVIMPSGSGMYLTINSGKVLHGFDGFTPPSGTATQIMRMWTRINDSTWTENTLEFTVVLSAIPDPNYSGAYKPVYSYSGSVLNTGGILPLAAHVFQNSSYELCAVLAFAVEATPYYSWYSVPDGSAVKSISFSTYTTSDGSNALPRYSSR